MTDLEKVEAYITITKHEPFRALAAQGSEVAARIAAMYDAHVARRAAEPPLPSLRERALNLARATIQVAGTVIGGEGFLVSEQDAQARLAICEGCPKFRASDRTCSVCGCNMDLKTHLAAMACPLDPPKWTAHKNAPDSS